MYGLTTDQQTDEWMDIASCRDARKDNVLLTRFGVESVSLLSVSLSLCEQFLDASLHLYKWVCPSVGPSVGPSPLCSGLPLSTCTCKDVIMVVKLPMFIYLAYILMMKDHDIFRFF